MSLPENLSFILAVPQDSKELSLLAQLIWRQHFTPVIGAEQVEYMLKNFQSPSAIEEFIAEGYEYYFIKLADKSVGYLAIQNRKDHLHLSKFYILEKFRGKGVGRQAFDFITQRAKDMKLPSIRLVVNKDNSNTIEVYKKMGLKIIGSPITDIGGGFVMDDYEFEMEIC